MGVYLECACPIRRQRERERKDNPVKLLAGKWSARSLGRWKWSKQLSGEVFVAYPFRKTPPHSALSNPLARSLRCRSCRVGKDKDRGMGEAGPALFMMF